MLNAAFMNVLKGTPPTPLPTVNISPPNRHTTRLSRGALWKHTMRGKQSLLLRNCLSSLSFPIQILLFITSEFSFHPPKSYTHSGLVWYQEKKLLWWFPRILRSTERLNPATAEQIISLFAWTKKWTHRNLRKWLFPVQCKVKRLACVFLLLAAFHAMLQTIKSCLLPLIWIMWNTV